MARVAVYLCTFSQKDNLVRLIKLGVFLYISYKAIQDIDKWGEKMGKFEKLSKTVIAKLMKRVDK